MRKPCPARAPSAFSSETVACAAIPRSASGGGRAGTGCSPIRSWLPDPATRRRRANSRRTHKQTNRDHGRDPAHAVRRSCHQLALRRQGCGRRLVGRSEAGRVAAATNCSGSTATPRRKRRQALRAWRCAASRPARRRGELLPASGGNAADAALRPQPNAGLGRRRSATQQRQGGERSRMAEPAVVAVAEAQSPRERTAGEVPMGAEPVDRPQLLLDRRVLRRGRGSPGRRRARPPGSRLPRGTPASVSRGAGAESRQASGRTGKSCSP